MNNEIKLINRSSTARELEGLRAVIDRHRLRFAGSIVEAVLDSSAAVSNCNKFGGPKMELVNTLRELQKITDKYNITVRARWVKRELNKRADRLSRLKVPWKLRPKWRAKVEDSFPNVRILPIDFNNIATQLARASKATVPCVIIHPTWTSKSWSID